MLFIPVMKSWIFWIITPVLHDPSEIILICWFATQETFPIIISVENNILNFVKVCKFYKLYMTLMSPVFASVMYIFIPNNSDFQIGKLLIFYCVLSCEHVGIKGDGCN